MKKKVIYQADDGTEFESQSECSAYEKGKKLEKNVLKWLKANCEFEIADAKTLSDAVTATFGEHIAATNLTEILETILFNFEDFITTTRGTKKPGRTAKKGAAKKTAAKKTAAKKTTKPPAKPPATEEKPPKETPPKETPPKEKPPAADDGGGAPPPPPPPPPAE